MQQNGRVSWINMPKIVEISVSTWNNMFEKLLKQQKPILLSHILCQFAAFFILLPIKLQLWFVNVYFIQLRTSLKRVLMLFQKIPLKFILSFVLDMLNHYNLWLAFYVIPIVKRQGDEAVTLHINIHKFWSFRVVLMTKISQIGVTEGLPFVVRKSSLILAELSQEYSTKVAYPPVTSVTARFKFICFGLETMKFLWRLVLASILMPFHPFRLLVFDAQIGSYAPTSTKNSFSKE